MVDLENLEFECSKNSTKVLTKHGLLTTRWKTDRHCNTSYSGQMHKNSDSLWSVFICKQNIRFDFVLKSFIEVQFVFMFNYYQRLVGVYGLPQGPSYQIIRVLSDNFWHMIRSSVTSSASLRTLFFLMIRRNIMEVSGQFSFRPNLALKRKKKN